jgi:hypothetical protein
VSVRIIATWPEPELLPALRTLLGRADEALMCVAFANLKGVHLLERELERLGDRTRIVLTTTFQDSSAAIAKAADSGARVRVLNLAGGTYHPKLYLTSTGLAANALIGSANLTSGLVSNIEAATLLVGRRDEPPLREAWQLGERLWAHHAAVDWTPTPLTPRVEPLPVPLRHILEQSLTVGTTIRTISDGRPNTIRAVTPEGVYIETEASLAKGRPAQIVPGWMIDLAWEYLEAHGSLTNAYLLSSDGLNVKRSSAVCAILACLPDVEVTSTRPIELRLRRDPRSLGLVV